LKRGNRDGNNDLENVGYRCRFLQRRPAKVREDEGCEWEIPFPSYDLGALLFFLTLDPDTEVKAAALSSLRDMPMTC